MNKDKEDKIEYLDCQEIQERMQMLREFFIMKEEIRQIKQIIKDKFGIEIGVY